MMKAIWQVWLDKNHMLGGFDSKEEAEDWVKRYAPECMIKQVEIESEEES